MSCIYCWASVFNWIQPHSATLRNQVWSRQDWSLHLFQALRNTFRGKILHCWKHGLVWVTAINMNGIFSHTNQSFCAVLRAMQPQGRLNRYSISVAQISMLWQQLIELHWSRRRKWLQHKKKIVVNHVIVILRKAKPRYLQIILFIL